jgi:non-ribosomal peptide synthetase component F/acyl carrier protein
MEELIQRRLSGAASPAPVIGRADRHRPLPMSAGQRQMWVLHRLDPASTAYLMSWTLRLSGPLDVDALGWAWQRLVHRHEILRTRYAQVGEEPTQVIDPPGPFAPSLVDTGEALQFAARERQRPFDLQTEHPLRVALLRHAPDDHFMVVTMHHIACDAASFGLIAGELGILYRGRVTGVPVALAEPAVQYADFAAWEAHRASTGALRPHLEYWRRRLDGLGELRLPVDRPRPARPDWRGGVIEVPIGAERGERVRALAAEHRASPYMVLLAAFHATLSALSGAPDVAVGTPVSARTRPELDDLVGYGINTVVIRARCEPDGSFADLLGQVREGALEALDHREAPFPMVVDELRPARGAASNPLFQVAFDLNDAEEGTVSLPGVDVTYVRPEDWTLSKFDLTLHVTQAPSGWLHASLEYAKALFDEGTARRFAASYDDLLDRVLLDPKAPLGVGVSSVAPPTTVDREPRRDEAPPDGAVLAALRHAWGEILRIEKVDPDDNFFDVGGDSLRAVALAGRLKDLGFEVTAADIFANQTIAELAGVIPGTPRDAVASGGVAPFAMVSEADRNALPAGLVDAYPVGAAQLGMIVEMRARPDRSRYQDTTSFRIRDDEAFAPAAFQAAAQLAVDRHEVLRTSFDLNGYTAPLQLVHRAASIVAGVTDHGVLGPDGWEPLMRAYAARQRAIPMDLSAAPLFRIHAHVAAGTTDWWLSVTECHPILEGWSFHSLLMEILTSYRELRAGRTPAAPDPVPFRFADHIAAERAAVASTVDREYWQGVVAGRVPAELPPAWQGDRDAPEERYQHTVFIDDIEQGLRGLATRTSTSLKAVLLAAHLTVMSAAVGREDFFTGLVCDARPEIAGADRVPGMYLNTLPFACPPGARTWEELVRRVYDDLTAMWPHRRYPMQVIQQEAGHSGRLIDVMFNYLDFHQVDQELVGWAETIDETDNEFALHVFTMPGLLRLNTTTYALSRPAAKRFGAMYRSVLERMASGTGGEATEACLPAGEAERLRAYGTGPALAARPVSVPEAFAQRVREQPDAPAARWRAETLSYADLDAAAAKLARRLQDAGVGPGQLVAAAPARDLSALVVPLAVWKAGAAWLPVPLGQLAEAGAHALVEPPADAPEVVVLPGRRAGAPSLDGAACVLAGVVVSHRALAHALASVRGVVDEPAGGPVWLSAGASSTAAELVELLLPLTAGGQVVLGPHPAPDGVAELSAILAAGAVTHVQLTSLAAEAVLSAGPAVMTAIAGPTASPSGLSPAGTPVTVIVGADPPGAPGGTGLAGTIAATGPAGGAVVVATGVGEVPGWLAFGGRPLPGVTLSVRDHRLRPVPIGVAGELCVGGPLIGDGYLDDPARTAARFVPDPAGCGARLFRTGRLARFDDGGRLEQLGPIEPLGNVDWLDLRRIRDALCAQPAVLDAYALPSPDLPEGRNLVGYVRTVAGAPFDAAGLRRSIAARLPRRLVPELLVSVDAWPSTPRGALDPGRLPAPDGTRPAADRPKPWDDTFESLLRSVLTFLPPEEPLTPELELAAAGLDSLSTMELLASLENAYDIVIPDERLVLDMFETAGTLWDEISELR